MKTYNTILFDLDGTLTDSKEGIINSIRHALSYFDIVEDDMDKLKSFIGPPLKDSFKVLYGFDDHKADVAIVKYREYFKDRGIFENEVYLYIPEMLSNLKRHGKTLIVATSKPTVFAKRILEHFDLMEYFSDVIGSNLDGTMVEKSEVIKYALDKNNITDLDSTIMVGDRKYDIEGARDAGIDCIAVLYGFGTSTEINEGSPLYIAKTVQDIEKIILG